MTQWFEVNEIEQEYIKFVVLLTEYKGHLIIIRNKKRGDWEIPGGTKSLPDELNFGDMFYKMHSKWIEYGAKNSNRCSFDLSGNATNIT